MDLEIRAAYVKFDHEQPKMVIRGDAPAIEDVGESYITFTAEDLESEDLDNIVSQCMDLYDTYDGFLEATGDRDGIKDHLIGEEDFETDYSPEVVLDQYDGEWSWCTQLGELWRNHPNMQEELSHFIEAVGLEKIKEILGIKMVIFHQPEVAHEEGQEAQVH